MACTWEGMGLSFRFQGLGLSLLQVFVVCVIS